MSDQDSEYLNNNGRLVSRIFDRVTITDEVIQDLIRLPKMIESKIPTKGYKDENGHRRCTLNLQAAHKTFTVFIRQHERFIENFSMGLRYQTGDKMLGTITLIRYNGPHGEASRYADGHYAKPHIHRVTAVEVSSGSTQPQERVREITDRYATFDQALLVFFEDVAASNYHEYFPDLREPRLIP